MEPIANEKQYVPKKERAAFWVSAFLRDMSYAMSNQVMTFYIDVMGFANERFSWILKFLPVVERVYDGVNDPLVGAYYDRRKHGDTKAKPFFKWTALPIAIGLFCLFVPITFSRNEGVNMVLRALFAFLAYALYEGFQTANATAHMSLYNSITPNTTERGSIVSIARMFAAGGNGLISGLLPVLYGTIAPDDVGGKRTLYLGMAGGTAICNLLYNYIMYSKVKERTIAPVEEKVALRPLLVSLLKNKPFIIILIANAISGLLNAGSTGLYFYQYNIGNTSYQTLVGLMAIPCYLLAGAITPKLIKAYEKRSVWLVCSALQAILNIAYILIGYNPVIILFIYSFLSSLPGSIKQMLYWNMVADTVDYGEWTTGKRSDGMIYAIEGLSNKIIGAFGQMSTALIIQYIGFVPNAKTQSQRTLDGLFRVPQYIGLSCVILSAVPYFFYDFSRAKQTEAIAAIAARRESVPSENEI
ncbi:MAG: MFS transporter [Oscillospiraceae bacterium]|jgi:Na+/melibiose symporter-like transporter|nr:MFS transporter [Oscillospiraceae bacterium]